MKKSRVRGGLVGAAVIVASMVTIAQQRGSTTVGAPNGEWRTYGADLRSTRYAPLDQINKDNFSKLEVAWRFKTDALGPRPEFNLQSTPLMVGGVLYSTGGTRRAVVALDAGTGEMLWMYSLNEGKRGESAPRQLSGGQEQRVGIARAIVADPTFLLCDEPTGDLDRKSADEVLDLLDRLVRDHGKTVLMVTHDPLAAERARLVLHLEKGVLVESVTAGS